jgi:hypothetical protein
MFAAEEASHADSADWSATDQFPLSRFASHSAARCSMCSRLSMFLIRAIH